MTDKRKQGGAARKATAAAAEWDRRLSQINRRIITLGEKTETFSGWARSATVGGKTYRVGIDRGKAVRIPYKPRGQNIGHHYRGWVMDSNGRNIFCDRVGGSLGARGLLELAGVFQEGGAS